MELQHEPFVPTSVLLFRDFVVNKYAQ